MMKWEKLLSRKRIINSDEHHVEEAKDMRSEFERDYSRILYSNAFRRLHNKTQLFPMPINDHVHSRLTHSIEVADVGWALGKYCGEKIIDAHPTLKDIEILSSDFANIVAAACLAHDLGNPPFGHKGEDAIASYFQSPEADPYLNLVSDQQKSDLRNFEGNAQGLRIISRISERVNRGGMRLTAATVGAFSKYPRCSNALVDSRLNGSLVKKFGIFSTEEAYFKEVASELGLLENGTNSWCRHPLAFLMEAADDICYSILDLEDGFNLRLVPYERFKEVMQPIAKISESKLNESPSDSERVGHLRAKAIHTLVGEVINIFVDDESRMLDGSRSESLVENSTLKQELTAIRDLTKKLCYTNPIVVKIEIAGYRVLNTILSELLKRLFAEGPASSTWLLERPRKQATPIEKIMFATDYVSRMTDRYAISTYRHLLGISLPTEEL